MNVFHWLAENDIIVVRDVTDKWQKMAERGNYENPTNAVIGQKRRCGGSHPLPSKDVVEIVWSLDFPQV
jgi:hypothetical protein